MTQQPNNTPMAQARARAHELRDTFVRELADGKSFASIARELGVNDSTVARAAKKYGADIEAEVRRRSANSERIRVGYIERAHAAMFEFATGGKDLNPRQVAALRYYTGDKGLLFDAGDGDERALTTTPDAASIGTLPAGTPIMITVNRFGGDGGQVVREASANGHGDISDIIDADGDDA